MIFGYLLLAHMLGDFVFQPGRLVAWKIRSKIGLAVHAMIHFAITLLLFVPFFIYGSYNNSFILAAAIVSVAHFFIDAAKIHYELSHDKKNVSFIADQLCHLGVIAIISHLFRGLSIPRPPSSMDITRGLDIARPYLDDYYGFHADPYFITSLAFVIFITIGLEIYHFQKLRTQNSGLKLKPRYGRILLRLMVFVLVWFIYTFSTSYII